MMGIFGKKKETKANAATKQPPQSPPAAPPQTPEQNQPQASQQKTNTRPQFISTIAQKAATTQKRQGTPSFKLYLEGMGAKKKGLEHALKEQGVKSSLYEFVRNMLIAGIMLGIVIGATMIILFQHLGVAPPKNYLLGGMLGAVMAYMAFNMFLDFPTHKTAGRSKNIERDILFAARDMIISLRSGMPLFNAITSISTGYGDASAEFAKIVERVQIGMPLDEAIDQTVSESKSQSFRRIMLQASVSIRAGADVVSALQSVIDQLSQERIIELRRYGQRLNAIAMFYMLFGIILPSMGIAVVTILTTFIAVFTVNTTVLEFALVGIVFLQIVFLMMITGSRPVFSL